MPKEIKVDVEIVFVVGKNLSGEGVSPIVWEIIGIYGDKEKALSACTKDNYFLGPIVLNKTLPDESEIWPGCYYPAMESKEDAEKTT